MAAAAKEMELAIKIAGKIDSSFNSALGKVSSGISSAAKAAAAGTVAAVTAVGGLGLAAVNTGRQYEQSMSQVQATMLIDTNTEEGAAQMATLEEAARKMGRETVFSATDAADALNYLALAGYDADKAAAALPTVLNLAGAGAMDLAAASDMVTDSMSALGIEATQKNLTAFSDQMAQTASKANTNVAQLGEAILTVGGTAKTLSGGTVELNTALGLLADNGMKGSEGGTKLRNMILSLQSPTDDAAEALSSMGVSVYDSEGQMKSLQSIFGDLNTAMSAMSPEERSNVLSSIFNKTDLKAANALLGTSTERWDELTGAVENSAGACENMYKIQLDNLNGDLAILKSGVEDLGISLYEDFAEPIRDVVQTGISMVGELSDAYKEGGLSGLADALGGVFAEALIKIGEYAPQLVNTAVELVNSLAQGIADNADTIGEQGATLIWTLVGGIIDTGATLITTGLIVLDSFLTGLEQKLATGELQDKAQKAIEKINQGLKDHGPEIINAGINCILYLLQGIGQAAPDIIAGAAMILIYLADGISQNAESIMMTGLYLVGRIAAGLIDALPAIGAAAIRLIVALSQAFADHASDIISVGMYLIGRLITGLIQNLPAILSAGATIIANLAVGVVRGIGTLLTGIPGLFGQIGDAILKIDWLAVGVDIVTKIWDGVKKLWGEFISWLTDTEAVEKASAYTQADIPGYTETMDGRYTNDGGMTYYTAQELAAQGVEGASNAVQVQAQATASSGVKYDEPIGPQPQNSSQSGAGWLAQQGATISKATPAYNSSELISAISGSANGASAVGTDWFNFDSTQYESQYKAMGEDAAKTTSEYMGTTLQTEMPTKYQEALDGLTSTDVSIVYEGLATTASPEANAAAQQVMDGVNTTVGTGVDTMGATFETGGAAAGTNGMNAMNSATEAGGTTVQGTAQGIAAGTVLQFSSMNGLLYSAGAQAMSGFVNGLNDMRATVLLTAQGIASAVESAFNGMSITIPRPRLPIINVSTSSIPYGNGGNVTIPHFSVAWNALGGIFRKATVLNTGAGLQGFGEAGPEAVLPLDTLWAQMRQIMREILQGESGGPVGSLLGKIGGGGSQGQPQPAFAGAGGPSITYAPVYQIQGNASRADLEAAGKAGYEDFKRWVKQYERELRRTKF